MLAAPPPATLRDDARTLLVGLARHGVAVDPRWLDEAELDALPTERIALTSTFEARGVRVLPERAVLPRKPRAPMPDPWTLDDLAQPAGTPVGRKREIALGERAVADCERCGGRGERRCDACHGMGLHQVAGAAAAPCRTCSVQGRVVCVACEGLGGFEGPVFAWSEIGESTIVRVVRPKALPDDVALAVEETLASGGGVEVHREEAPRIDAIGLGARLGGGTYRDGARANELGGELARMLDELDGQGAAHVRAQRLEVRRVSVIRIAPRGRAPLYTWGPPARVWPDAALAPPALPRIPPLALVGIALGVLGYWYWFSWP